MTRRVLHPSDFTSPSRAAFRKAIEMTKANRAQLLVVHVLRPIVPLPGDVYISPKMYEDLASSARSFVQKQLDKLLAQTQKAGVRAKGFLLEGAPHDEIIRFARARGVDLIVMGTHGRRGLAKFFVGSVADRVVAGASCPVMTVRGK